MKKNYLLTFWRVYVEYREDFVEDFISSEEARECYDNADLYYTKTLEMWIVYEENGRIRTSITKLAEGRRNKNGT